MRFGMTDSDIEALCGVFSLHPNVEKAVLYGSRAKGSNKPFSDVDLTLFGDVSHNELTRIYLEIDDLLLPYQFDISAHKRLSDKPFLAHIQRNGKTLYRRKRVDALCAN